MKVITKPGERCPMEGRPRQYITDDIPVEVPETAYYRRLLREGSIFPVKAERWNVSALKRSSVEKLKEKGGKE